MLFNIHSFLLSMVLLLPAQQQLKKVTISGYAQGTTYRVIYYHPDCVSFRSEIESLLMEIDQSMSLYQSNSLINVFNHAKRGVKMDNHMKMVVKKSIKVAKRSNGYLDITIKPLMDAWGFGVTANKKQVPDSATIKKLLGLVDYKLLKIKGDSLIKCRPAMQIDLNGIAQGYTVDEIARFLRKQDVKHFLVEVGGEVVASKCKPNGKAWSIGIESPEKQKGQFLPIQKVINLADKGISTSGNYRKFFETGGKHYSHTINPLTGYALSSKIISVSVVAPNAITSDAYDNVFMLMGVEKSLQFLRNHKQLEAYFIYKNSSGMLSDTCSDGFKTYFKN